MPKKPKPPSNTTSNVVPIRPGVQIPEQSNVVPFEAPTCLDLDPDKVLAGGMGKFTEVVVVGRTKDERIYYASSSGYLPNVHWMLAQAMRECMDQSDDDDEPPLLTG